MKNLAEEQMKIELLNEGIQCESVYDFVNSKKPYPSAIPILIRYLNENLDKKFLEGVIRALTVKEAKGKANENLLSLFYKLEHKNEILKWLIGNAMHTIITKNDIKEVTKIVKNKKNGISRQMFVLALSKIKSNSSEIALIELLGDKEVATHAISALGNIKSKKAESKIKPYLSSKNSFLRNTAKTALLKINGI